LATRKKGLVGAIFDMAHLVFEMGGIESSCVIFDGYLFQLLLI